MVNRSMDVDERSGKIVFLRKIREGPASKSYGLHVAALAGLPEGVLRRAGEIMSRHKKEIPAYHNAPFPEAETRKSLPGSESKVLRELSELEINTMTPLEALNLIQQWKNTIDKTIGGEKKPVSVQKINNASKLPVAEPSLFDPN